MTDQSFIDLLAFFAEAVVSVTDLETGRIEALAGPFEALSGYTPEEAIGRTLGELKLYAHSERRDDFRRELKANGAVRGLLIDGQHKSGTPRLVEIHSRFVELPHARRLVTAIRPVVANPRFESISRVLHTLFLAQEVTVWEMDLATLTVRHHTADGVVEVSSDQRSEKVHPGDLPRVRASYQALLAGQSDALDAEFRERTDGGWRWLHTRGRLERDADGTPVRLIGVNLDVGAAHAAREALAASRQFTDDLLATANVMVVGLDLAGHVCIFNQAAERITGWAAADVMGRSWFETLVPTERFPEVVAAFKAAKTAGRIVGEFENPVITASGGERRILWRNSHGTGPDGQPMVLSFGIDVTAQRAAEGALAHRALHDALTDLPNRQLFNDRLAHEQVRAARAGHLLAVHLLDLDHFKDINDAFGHPIGDALLRAVADRLRGALRGGDTVARLGGDEFAVLQVEVDDVTAATALADRLMAALREPLDVEGQQMHIATSVGIALCDGRQGAGPDELLRRADLALYQAKGDGRDRSAVHNDAMSARFAARVELMHALDSALDAGQLSVWYQPQVTMADGKITGVEALVRWRSRDTPPGVFVPLAEQTGRVVALGRMVMDHALAAGRRWAERGLLPPTLAVNVSAVELRDSRYATSVLAALDRHRLSPTRLELEVTETSLLRPGRTERHNLDRLADAGVRFAIDDFGTGYSSLRMLEALPAWRIKIAQEFVRDMLGNAAHAEIVRATVGVAREFGQVVIAEGIEAPDVRDALLALGCHQGQGYWYARPAPEAETGAMLRVGRLPLAD